MGFMNKVAVEGLCPPFWVGRYIVFAITVAVAMLSTNMLTITVAAATLSVNVWTITVADA